jgi:CelD/BcsL family acetyltransferase involved in cellulose biosynthesis
MQFSLITDPAEWHSLEAEWQALAAQTHRPLPFLEFWYQQTWWQTLGGGEWSHESSRLQLIIARQDGLLLGAAPLFYSEKADNPPALRFIGQIEVSDYLDFLCPQSELQPFIAGLLDFIKTEPGLLSRSLDLANFQDDSPSLPLLSELCEQKGVPYNSEVLQPSPYIPMKPGWEEYLASISKKQRHEIRRKLRNADSHHENDWFIVTVEHDLQEEMQTFFDMMRNDPSKVAFLTPEMESFLSQIAARALEVGQLHLSFLIFDGKKAAAYLSFLSGHKLWVYNSAWNPDFGCCSPGWVLLAKVINWAIEQGLTEVDMMRGDEEYKYRIGGIDRHVVSFKTQLL